MSKLDLLTVTAVSCITACCAACVLSPASVQAGDTIIVQGADGTTEYGQQFADWAASWSQIARQMKSTVHALGPTLPSPSQHDRLAKLLNQLPASGSEPVLLVFIGHGTFFQDQAKFNLVGPDVTADELASWLQRIERPVAIVNCASSSGAFLPALSARNRIVITSTKSGREQNFARFGQYLAAAAANPKADLDHDGAISLLEAFLAAAHDTAAFYKDQARLATEHALLDDNADGIGTSADFFTGIRATQSPRDETQQIDGLRAHQWTLIRLADTPPLTAEQRQRRDELEQEIERLRRQKPHLEIDEYYARLEPLVHEIAVMYEQSRSR